MKNSIYDYVVKNGKGEDVNLSDFKGKVMLIVNTATGCGFTPQYDGLQALYEKYHDKGFEILDFPCNQFANQAPGSHEEIANFCSGRFGVTFPQLAKVKVNGKDEEPLYTYLKAQKGGAFGGRIKWNFTKFLVDREGNVTERFGSAKTPDMIEKNIEALL